MKVITRNNSDSYGKPRVYFCCHPDDFSKHFDKIIHDILLTHDCAIYYTEDMSESFGEENLDNLFENMRLFVVPVTMKLLCLPNRAMDVDIEYAKRNKIPILPFMMEPVRELYSFYSNENKFGFLQFIDPDSSDSTEIKYRDKLEKYLDSVILKNELIEKIKGAFYAQIFLSYRKKDRKYANELMKLIHDIPGGENISIWYDEFLVFGEDWREGIWNAMQNSSLFAMLVTPSLLEPGNFVMDKEYPYAKDNNMDILPIRMDFASESEIEALTSKLEPSRIIVPDDNEFKERFLDVCTKEVTRISDEDHMHNFLIGLAYLDGIGVEKDNKRAMQLITAAAEAGLTEAIEMLVKLYSGLNHGDIGVACNLVKWQEKLLENYKGKYDCRDKRVLDAMLELVSSYATVHDSKAMPLLMERHGIICEGLDENHPDRLASMADVVIHSLIIGEYGVEREFSSALFTHITSDDCKVNQHLFDRLRGVVTIYVDIEDYFGALKWEKAIYELKLRTLDEYSEETLLSLSNIAKIKARCESFENYISAWEEAHQVYCKVYSPESEKTALLTVDLALEYINRKREIDAKELLEHSYEILCRLYSPTHPTAIRVLYSIGNVNSRICAYKLAKEQLTEVYEWRRLYLGEHHKDTVDAYFNLGNVYYRAQEYDKALDYFEDTNALLDKLIDERLESHKDTFAEDMMKKSIYSRLVECYLYFKRYQDAYNCQKKVCMYANMEDPFEESDEERRALEKLKAIRKLMEE